MSDRRNFFTRAAALGAGLLAARARRAEAAVEPLQTAVAPRRSSVAVETPDLPEIPFTMDGNVKVFRLTAEVVRREIVAGRMVDMWGYNGSCPGPAIQVTEGDRVRVEFENRLPEATTVHWHGLEVPIGMDGTPHISQPPVPPGGRFTYEFTLNQHGTFFYHSHGAMQEMMGMVGMFIIHPKVPYEPHCDHDFGIILQGWALLPNNTVPNTTGMEFNWLTFNGRAAPATTPMISQLNGRVRIRIVNLSMNNHPVHLHGHQFVVTGSEGGRQPRSTWGPGNTVLVGAAQARVVEFEATNEGDWMLHCHLPHHMMNNMTDLMGERMLTSSPLSARQAQVQMAGMAGMNGGAEMPGMSHAGMTPAPVSPDAETVPGFPQDAFMEMAMFSPGAKPETEGLAENWALALQGMATLVRVLPPSSYASIQRRRGRSVASARGTGATRPASADAAPTRAPDPHSGMPGMTSHEGMKMDMPKTASPKRTP